MRKVLVTGFEPFGGSVINPSQLVVIELTKDPLDNCDLITEVLPVEYGKASSKLLELIDIHKPEIVISLGQAEGRSEISIERIAINLADAKIADNGGNLLINQPIFSSGQPGYFSSLPVAQLVTELRSAKFKASQSLSAGSFVCNYIFYQMQAKLVGSGILSGFIHLPLVPEQQAEFPQQPTMPLNEMVQGIRLIINYLTESIEL